MALGFRAARQDMRAIEENNLDTGAVAAAGFRIKPDTTSPLNRAEYDNLQVVWNAWHGGH